MPADSKGRPRWQQALVLFAVGGIIGYISLIGMTRGMWSGDSLSKIQKLYMIVFFASATAFISGIVLFFGIAVKALISLIASVTQK